MKAYELRFLDARGGTLLAYMGDFSDNDHAVKKFASLRDIPCDRAELWCGEEMVIQEWCASKKDAPAVARAS
jgi:hypothetical protein